MRWIPKLLGTVITICLIHEHSCRKHSSQEESPESSDEPVVKPKSKHRKPVFSVPRETKTEKWRFEFDVPALLRTLKHYTGLSIGLAGTEVDNSDPNNVQKPVSRNNQNAPPGLLNKKYTFEVTPPDVNNIFQTFQNLLLLARRYNRVYYGYTEEGPGVIKSDNVTYPPRYQEGKLFNLLRLKKKRNRGK